jgi:hypothetical protein
MDTELKPDHMKSFAARPAKHVVALFNASDDTVEMVRRMLDAGRDSEAFEIVGKPYDLGQIKAAIHAALRQAEAAV